MNKILCTLVVPVVLAAAGCTSAPINYYYLEPLSSTEAPPSDFVARLAIEEVRVPPYLDRFDIVTQKQANSLEVSGVDQWAEPLDDGFARVIRSNLSHLLAENKVIVVPADFTRAEAEVSVYISRFEVDAAGTAVLEAQWRILRTGDDLEILFRRSEHRQAVAGEGYPAITVALNETLHALSRDIARGAAEEIDAIGKLAR